MLDVGCDTGKLVSLLNEEGVEDVVGIDPSPTQLSTATGVVIRGDASALPFPEDTFGGDVYAVLYHLSDPVAAVAECYRVLCSLGACSPHARRAFLTRQSWRPHSQTVVF